jgi:hypothetical protein
MTKLVKRPHVSVYQCRPFILFENINIIIIRTGFKCSSQFTVFENINMIMIAILH